MKPPISYSDAPFEVRADLTEAQQRSWERIAAPGAWFRGVERVAIAEEARLAPSCSLCTRRLEALSPYTVEGRHDGTGRLPEPLVEAVHRLRTDAARTKRSWFDDLRAAGLSEEQYVEALGIVAVVVTVDTFCRGIGQSPPPLPQPLPGAPSGYRPERLTRGEAWVPMLVPGDVAAPEADLFPDGKGANSKRALSLAPDEVRSFFGLVISHYLAPEQQWDFSTRHRAISNAQIELVAGRVSALNGCAY